MASLLPKLAVFARPATWLLLAVALAPVFAVLGGWMEPLSVLASYWWEYAVLGISGLIQLALVNRAALRESASRGIRHALATFLGAAAVSLFITGLVLVILVGLLADAAESAGLVGPDIDLWRGLGATWTNLLAAPDVLLLAAILGAAQLTAVALDFWLGAPFDSHRSDRVHRKLFIFALPYLVFTGTAAELLVLWPAGLVIGLLLAKLWLELMERSWYTGAPQDGTENANADHESQNSRDREVV